MAKQVGRRIAGVDGLVDGGDGSGLALGHGELAEALGLGHGPGGLGVALGLEDLALAFALGPQDGGFLLALGGGDGGLATAIGLGDHGTTGPLGLHLLVHGVHDVGAADRCAGSRRGPPGRPTCRWRHRGSGAGRG
jgi:hypothetical protein